MTGQQSPSKVPAGAGRWHPRWQTPAVCLALAAITFAVFGQTLRHGFVNYDDNDYVYGNPVVTHGLTLKGLVSAFTHVYSNNWHPLTWLSHMLDCQLYGLNPGEHHLTNVLLHTATVIALFLVLRQMTGALWRSAVVAAVFAIHPLRVESVAWVAERKDVLSGLFFVLTIAAYVRYARGPRSLARYGLVMLLLAMGLMCKPMLVTLPLVLLLLDYWPLQRLEPAGRLLLEKLPLLALSAVSCAATLLVQTDVIQLTESYAMPLRIANALASCMVYLGQMVWPAGLAVYYPYPRHGLPVWEVALAGALLAGLSLVAWRRRRKQPWIAVGWLWYLVMLLPVVGIIQVGGQAHADRYTHLPVIGVVMAGTWLVGDWSMGWKHRRTVLGSLMAAVMGVLMVCAWKQTSYWSNSETLWTHTLACTTANDVAHLNLGVIYFQEGRLDEAIDQYQMTMQIQMKEPTNPYHSQAYNNLGLALFRKGNVDEAITLFEQALRTNPDYAAAHYNFGSALLQKGRLDEAIAHYQRALEIEPDDPQSQNILAWLLATRPQESLRNGNKAVALAQQANALTGGQNPVVLRTLAAACAEAGRFSEAVETAQRALQLAEAQSNTGLAGHLQSEIKLYQAGGPIHSPAQPH